MRIVTILSGMFVIGTGIWCFAHPGAPFVATAFLLGSAMLIHGLSNILVYIVYRKRISYVLWQLAEGFITVVLAAIVLSGVILTDDRIMLFFGMWVLFSGALHITASADIRKENVAGWYWVLLIGIPGLLAGVYSVMDPFLAGLALAITIGGVFILQGANCVLNGILLINGTKIQAVGEATDQKLGRHEHENARV